MTKTDRIKYILENQKDVDTDLVDDFQTYTKTELEEMSASEVKDVYSNLLQAEEIMDDIYESEYIRHGRSE